METKVCSRCNKELPVSMFNRATKDGLQYYCKSCQKEANKNATSSHCHIALCDIKSGKFNGLDKYSPRTIIEYLGALGYSGTLEYTTKIKIGV